MSFRLGIVTYALDRSPTGIGQYTKSIISVLPGAGIDPILLLSGQYPYSGPVIPLHGTKYLPGLLTLGQAEIGYLAHKYELDLIHDPTAILPVAFSHVPVVVTIHDAIPFSHPKSSTTLDWLLYHYWLPLILKRVDHVITVSNSSLNDLKKYLKIPLRKITVIPYGTQKYFKPLPEEQITPILQAAGIERPYILYVGSIEPRKNLLRLIQAYAVLCKKTTRWNLVIVGARNYWKSSTVAQAVKEWDLEDCVHFTGYISNEDLPAYYNGADLFMFPSLYEGFGFPVLEAMACGTPVITSNISSLPEVAGDAALLIDPYNVNAIAEAMIRILEDHDFADELRQRGLDRAREFSWERTARETIAVYEKVLKRS